MLQQRTRFQTPMSNDQIRAVAPSVFQSEAHESRSELYTFVPTIEVLEAMRREGFEVFEAKQSSTRLEGRRDFTTHVLKLRHPDAAVVQGKYGAGERVEIILRNSHDGGSSFEVSQGVYRLICSNGMVASRTNATIRIPHRGDIIGDVIEGSFQIVESSRELASVIQDWRTTELDAGEQLALAEGARVLRFADTPTYLAESRVAAQLNHVRRWEDKGNDLWTTFNRVQENVIKGGINLGRSDKGTRVTSRAVKGVDQDLKLNKALWALSDALYKHKTGEVALAA